MQDNCQRSVARALLSTLSAETAFTLPLASSAARASASAIHNGFVSGSAGSSRLVISRLARRARERGGSLIASSSRLFRAIGITKPQAIILTNLSVHGAFQYPANPMSVVACASGSVHTLTSAG